MTTVVGRVTRRAAYELRRAHRLWLQHRRIPFQGFFYQHARLALDHRRITGQLAGQQPAQSFLRRNNYPLRYRLVRFHCLGRLYVCIL